MGQIYGHVVAISDLGLGQEVRTESAPLPDSASERREQGLAARAQEKTVNASARRFVQRGVRLAEPAEAFGLVDK